MSTPIPYFERMYADSPGCSTGNLTALMPQDWPDGQFDLVVLSDLAYYFEDTEPGDLLAAHWRRPVAEHFRDGDSVHAAPAQRPELVRTAEHVEADFRLEVFSRVPPQPRSVAQHEGLC